MKEGRNEGRKEGITRYQIHHYLSASSVPGAVPSPDSLVEKELSVCPFYRGDN